MDFTEDELQHEEWRPFPGFEVDYHISNLGRVMRTTPGINTQQFRILKLQSLRSSGKRRRYSYPAIALKKNGKKVHLRIHQIVALAFLGPKPEGYEVNHKDTDRTNPRANNLEYITHRENVQHAMDNGTFLRVHLTPETVKELRTLYATGLYSHKTLAGKFQISPSNVQRVVNRLSWAHIS